MRVEVDRPTHTVTITGADLSDFDLEADTGTLPIERRESTLSMPERVLGGGLLRLQIGVLVEGTTRDGIGEVSFKGQGLPGRLADVTGFEMTHLMVDDSLEGVGAGTFLFDIYRAVAIYHGGDAAGIVGGQTPTREFLISQGIPGAAISESANPLGPTARGQTWTVDAGVLADDPRPGEVIIRR